MGKHSILLLNFSEGEAELLRKSRFNVEIGATGKVAYRHPMGGRVQRLGAFFPRPVYEYDVYVHNSEGSSAIPATVRQKITALEASAIPAPLSTFSGRPFVRIPFIGESSNDALSMGGVPNVTLKKAHKADSILEVVDDLGGPFSIQRLHNLIASLRSQIKLPVSRYVVSRYTAAESSFSPHLHQPVIVNRNGDVVAAYGVVLGDAGMSALYIVMPQLKENAKALVEILELLVQLAPDWFPDVQLLDWYDGEELKVSEEKEIQDEIDRIKKRTDDCVAECLRKIDNVRTEWDFLKRILVATEDAEEAGAKLSASVRRVLEYLGFQVDDIDEKIRNAIRKEDFWIADEDFFAIGEVTGTVRKNPKQTEFSALLGRMKTIAQRADLRPERSRWTGMLIINHDLKTQPSRRPLLYSGGEEEVVKAAAENEIAVVSTVELHRIAMAVKEGKLDQKQARMILKRFGRIELEPSKIDTD